MDAMWQSFLSDYWPIISDNKEMWLNGIWTTLWLVTLSLLLGLVLAIPFGMILASKASRWVKAVPAVFSYFFRGTPMLVQLYLIYFGLGEVIGGIPGIRDSAVWPYFQQAWPWALLTFALNTAAYTSEIVRGAIETTPKGEIEAAISVGMNKRLIATRVVLPNALRRALPAYGNEVIFLLHGSAIASTVTMLDITGVARDLFSRYYEPFVPFMTAGALYLLITTSVVIVFFFLERYFNKHLSTRRV